MARRNRRRSRRNKALGLKLGLAGLSVVLLGAGSLVLAGSLGKVRPDEVGCFPGSDRHTVMWLDHSKPRWDKVQARDIETIFERAWFDDLGFNEQFTLITTEGDQFSSLGKERLTLCGSAKAPDDLAAIGAAAPQNAAYLTEERKRRFKKHLAPVVEELLDESPPKEENEIGYSPILESMQSISRRGDFSDSLGRRRLIIVSDLVQNTAGMAHFCTVKGDLPSFETFRKRLIDKGLEPEPFERTQVDIYILQRLGYGQGDFRYCTEREIHNFWRDYFNAYGAEVRIHTLLQDSNPA